MLPVRLSMLNIRALQSKYCINLIFNCYLKYKYVNYKKTCFVIEKY